MFRRLVLFFVLLGFAFAATAGKSSQTVNKQIEMSMQVTGTIDITVDGKVAAYTLDQQEKLPAGIVDIAAKLIPTWHFEPVQLAEDTVTRSTMRLLFVAKPNDGGNYTVRMQSTYFESTRASDLISVSSQSRLRFGSFIQAVAPSLSQPLSITTYVALKIGRDGKIANIDISRVDLGVAGRERDMQRMRAAFTRECLSAFKDMTFVFPSTGPDSNRDFWHGIIPLQIEISLDDQRPADPASMYGQWRAYVPGPTKLIPWLEDQAMAGNDAVAPDTYHSVRQDRRLLTPLDRS